MRTHGWSGATPQTDAEAVQRILAAAKRAIDERGADMRIADVARDLGVTRQTVYRYFPGTDALLVATAVSEAAPYLNSLTKHLRDIHDPADAVIEAIAYTLERLPKEKYLGLLLTAGRAGTFSAGVTSDMAVAFGRSMLQRFAVDWSVVGIADGDLDALAEYMLRVVQSFVVDPGRPPRQGAKLRNYLREWVAPAIVHHRDVVRTVPARRSSGVKRAQS
jgi:AcrR family transcriptional regulator